MKSPPVLNRRLLLETPERVADGAGGFVETWVTKGTIWAEITPHNGRERAGEEVTLSRVPYRIIVRAAAYGAPSRPRPGERFREGSRLYRILAVTEAERRVHYLTCFAEEETPV